MELSGKKYTYFKDDCYFEKKVEYTADNEVEDIIVEEINKLIEFERKNE